MITLKLTEEQAALVARALKQCSERYCVMAGDANRDGAEKLAEALWDEHCRFSDVHALVLKAKKGGGK